MAFFSLSSVVKSIMERPPRRVNWRRAGLSSTRTTVWRSESPSTACTSRSRTTVSVVYWKRRRPRPARAAAASASRRSRWARSRISAFASRILEMASYLA